MRFIPIYFHSICAGLHNVSEQNVSLIFFLFCFKTFFCSFCLVVCVQSRPIDDTFAVAHCCRLVCDFYVHEIIWQQNIWTTHMMPNNFVLVLSREEKKARKIIWIPLWDENRRYIWRPNNRITDSLEIFFFYFFPSHLYLNFVYK